MKTEARKMAEKMSKSKKNEDINELAREINRGGKPRGISSDIPAGIREKLVEKEKEAMFSKGEKNKYAAGGMSTKVGKVMKEFKAGSLHSGKGGKVVKSPKQAVAIALSEARRAKK
jgi:hypothetical protein